MEIHIDEPGKRPFMCSRAMTITARDRKDDRRIVTG